MNVLLIGSGGREHALAWKIAQSKLLTKLYAAPGSDAIGELAVRTDLDIKDHAAVVDFCRRFSVDLVVIGPEAPLADGLSDALNDSGIAVFGPKRKAAQLESSKSFAKDFLHRHKIPTAQSSVFEDLGSARSALSGAKFPIVVKADGLAAGKGVRICRDATEAETALKDYMSEGVLGDAGRRVLLEECLSGPEASIMGLCDGRRFMALPPSSDHKRLLDGDRGPNTGGMGVIAPTPYVDDEAFGRIRSEILDPVLRGLNEDGLEYRGALYCGVMLTVEGPKVLEFNVRFGDPETQAVLPLLTCDLLELLKATADGNLKADLIPYEGASVTVVLASEGYPTHPVIGKTLAGHEGVSDDCLIFHAGTVREGEGWKTKGGRVLGVTGLGKDLSHARRAAYSTAKRIRFDGAQYRRDIGEINNLTLEKTA